MLIKVLLALGVAFVVYAVVTQYKNTDETEGVPKRVWAAVVLAVGTLGTVVASWLDLVNLGN